MKKELVQITLVTFIALIFGCSKESDAPHKTEATNPPLATSIVRSNRTAVADKTASQTNAPAAGSRPRYERLIEAQQRLEAAVATKAAQADTKENPNAVDENGVESLARSPKPPKELLDRANSGDVTAQRELGRFFSDKGKLKEATDWYAQAAAKGDAEAQRMLGIAYIYGDDGVQRDLEKAGKWLLAAANQGDAEAQRELAKMFGDQSKFKESNEYLLRAANQGDKEAQRLLGLHYSVGEGVESNREEGKRWLTLAANQGDAVAQRELGRLFGERATWMPNDPNLKESNEWYLKAAQQGDVRAQHMMGVRYYFGQGVERNVEEANNWFFLAAQQGDAQSQFSIGMRWVLGEAGEAQDYAEAVKWFSLAANQGLDEAQARLGQRYANGEGVEQNNVEAYKWFWLAKQQGRVPNVATQLEAVASRMTRAEIEIAKRAASNFVPKPVAPLKP